MLAWIKGVFTFKRCPLKAVCVSGKRRPLSCPLTGPGSKIIEIPNWEDLQNIAYTTINNGLKSELRNNTLWFVTLLFLYHANFIQTPILGWRKCSESEGIFEQWFRRRDEHKFVTMQKFLQCTKNCIHKKLEESLEDWRWDILQLK